MMSRPWPGATIPRGLRLQRIPNLRSDPVQPRFEMGMSNELCRHGSGWLFRLWLLEGC